MTPNGMASNGVNSLMDGMIGSLEEQQFEIGGTYFLIEKLPPFTAWHTLEAIRRELGHVITKEAAPKLTEDDFQSIIMQVIFTLEPGFIDRLRAQLFSKLYYRNAIMLEFGVVGGSEDVAFEDMEPSAIYECFVRCMVVNFSGSVRAIMSKLAGSNLTSSQSIL